MQIFVGFQAPEIQSLQNQLVDFSIWMQICESGH